MSRETERVRELLSLYQSSLSSYAPEAVTGEGQTLLYSIPIFKRKRRERGGNRQQRKRARAAVAAPAAAHD